MKEDNRKIKELTLKDLGKQKILNGIVSLITQNKIELKEGFFECSRCGGLLREVQNPESRYINKPLECYKHQNGCGRSKNTTKFNLRSDLSKFSDYQEIKIRDVFDKRYSLKCILRDESVGKVSIGDNIIVRGTLKSSSKGHMIKRLNFMLEVSEVVEQ